MAQGEPMTRSFFRDTTAYFCYLLLVATIGPLQFGFHLVCDAAFIASNKLTISQAELNAPQDVINCKKKAISTTTVHPNLPQCIQMNTDQFAVVSSIYTLGGLLGALCAGSFCNKYGRLRAMRLTTLFFVLGPLMESLAVNIAVLCLGRFISGIGAGAAVVVVPIYVSEIAPPKEKGLFGAFTQVMINLGILIAQLLGYFFSRDSMWRLILAIAGGIGAVQLLGLSFVPESPKWLAEHHSPERARAILRRIRGHKLNIEEEVKAWNINSSTEDICISPCSCFKYIANGTR